jgi:hypothetical protein
MDQGISPAEGEKSRYQIGSQSSTLPADLFYSRNTDTVVVSVWLFHSGLLAVIVTPALSERFRQEGSVPVVTGKRRSAAKGSL